MTDRMIEISSINHGDYRVRFPVPAEVKVGDIATKLAKLIEASDRAHRVVSEVSHAQRAVIDASSADQFRMTELFEKGEGDDADPLLATREAEEELRKASARVDPARAAANIAYGELRSSVASNRVEWKKIARRSAESARDRIGAALKTLEVQRAELHAALGVLEMLAVEDLPRYLVANWSLGAPQMDEAIEATREAVVIVDRQVRAL